MQLRVTAQLIEGASGSHLWTKRYDRELSDAFLVGDQIAEDIVASLDVKLARGEDSRVWRKAIRTVEARDLFSQGQSAKFRSTLADNCELSRRQVTSMKFTAHSTAIALAAVGALSLSSFLAGCVSLMGPPTATATLVARSDSVVSGSLRFVEQSGGLRVTGEVRGLKPNGEHGFHVHEKGDCSSTDAASAGGHFNPGGMAHGHAGMPPHHAGDMPNLRADANGVARIDTIVRDLTLSEGKSSVLTLGVVVHRDPDDYQSQPAGNSGARVACGVITRA